MCLVQTRRRTALGFLLAALGVLIAWLIVSRGCGDDDEAIYWYFVIAATAAVAAGTYAYVTTIAPSWAALIASAIVAAVGGFGIFMFIVLTSISGCLN
jgi:hypothetical protein